MRMTSICMLVVKHEKDKTTIDLSIYEHENGALKETKQIETSTHSMLEIQGNVVIPLGLNKFNINLVIRDCVGNLDVLSERIVIR